MVLGLVTEIGESKRYMLRSWPQLVYGKESERISTENSLDQVLPIGISQETNLLIFRQYHLYILLV